MNIPETMRRLEAVFNQRVSSDLKINNANLLVHSDANHLHLHMAGGNANGAADSCIQVGQPVYIASVGKLFTAVLTGMLCEQGELSFESPIIDLLDAEALERLHVFRNKDYTDQIRLKHLLNHTSGLPDYFEDRPVKGKRMYEQIFNEPERVLCPREVMAWTKENLKPKFPPGKGFHYSDTGYQLLGLVIEAVTGVHFHQKLHHSIFEPLGMKQSYLIGHSLPCEASSYPVAGVYFGTTNIVGYRSLSADYAGGGVTAPLEDLLKFMQALAHGKLLSEQTFLRMIDGVCFAPGIDYGYGMMRIRPFPLLMPAKYSCWGNAGSTGAFMFYHPVLDSYLIGSLNRFRYHQKGIQFMLGVIDMLYKEIF